MQNVRQSTLKTIVFAGLAAGILDILAAILVYSVIKQATTPTLILQFIASAVFGEEAFEGGSTMALYGLVFHFIIAFSFAAIYCLAFPYISFLRTQKVLAGLLYGLFIWIVMNVIVLPLVFQRMPSFQLESALLGTIILMLCVGLPVALLTHRFLKPQSDPHS